MTPSMQVFARTATLLPIAGILLFTSACTIQKDSSKGGDDNVKVSTPFGGLKVRQDETTAATVGLPEYPGAHFITKKSDGDNGSVDVHMGFGPWQLHVQVASYGTADPQDKVTAFYKQALGKYGDVLTCSGHHPIGLPAKTADGLTCADEDKGGSTKWNKSNINLNDSDIELKTGSHRRQHIVGVKEKNGETRFSLIALELPDVGSHNDETN